MSDDFDQYKNYKWPSDDAYPEESPPGPWYEVERVKTKETNDLRGRVATLERDIRDIKAKLFDIYNRG